MDQTEERVIFDLVCIKIDKLATSQNVFHHIKPVPKPLNAGVLQTYEEDAHSSKLNLVPGIYSDATNKLYSFEVTKQAQQELINERRDKVY